MSSIFPPSRLTVTGFMRVLLACCGVLPVSAQTVNQRPAFAPDSAAPDVLQFVDPLIGTVNGGHVFSGATLPFGMAKAVADVDGEKEGGFASDGSNIVGFSHMHDSGTGGSPSLGNFPIFPQAGCPNDDINRCNFPLSDRATPRINGTVSASPGYFAITLATNIRTEMTVSNHTAIYRFTFPTAPVEQNATLSPLILADLIDLPLSRMNGSVSVDPDTGRIAGSGVFRPSFGIGTYTTYFCADFSGADIKDTGVFMNNRAGSYPKNLTVTPDGQNNSPEILPAGAWVQFEAPSTAQNQILSRVGVSFISEARACTNAEREIPDFDFNGTHNAARSAWTEALSTIEIAPGGASTDLQTVFWSGVYRSFISPQDYTGENPLWESEEPYYDSYYCIWDSFRSIHSFLTLVDPLSQELMIRSLIDIYRYEGKLPDCRMSFCKGFTQGGSNAEIILADYFLKTVNSGSFHDQKIDWLTAYEAMISDAEIEPANWAVEGRGGLTSWKSLGYIPADDFDPYGVGPFTRSVSRTVEYAYDDFCIAEVARALAQNQSLVSSRSQDQGFDFTGDYLKYTTRSLNWKNLFRADQTSVVRLNSTGSDSNPDADTEPEWRGFLQPKYLNGTWGYQDPIFCSPLLNFTSCYLNPDGHETYEGSSRLYTFFAPHDMTNLIRTLGLSQPQQSQVRYSHSSSSTSDSEFDDLFVQRLDYLHYTPSLLYLGDEQAFLLLYLYHYAGRPDRSAALTHHYIPAQFNTTLEGIPGNDDSGAMGSFAALTMMGIFPNPGQDVYFLTPPFFETIRITNRITGRTATITTVNFDPAYNNGRGQVIVNATLNGAAYTKSWIRHEFFLEGGVLELILASPEEEDERGGSSWGTRPEDRPPSLPLRG